MGSLVLAVRPLRDWEGDSGTVLRGVFEGDRLLNPEFGSEVFDNLDFIDNFDFLGLSEELEVAEESTELMRLAGVLTVCDFTF